MTDTIVSELNAPWTLHFEGDGTEDLAIIRDANGEDMAATRPFWQPEGDDPIPQTLAAALVMKAAPNLLRALVWCSSLLADHDESEGEEGQAYRAAIRAINEATELPEGR